MCELYSYSPLIGLFVIDYQQANWYFYCGNTTKYTSTEKYINKCILTVKDQLYE